MTSGAFQTVPCGTDGFVTKLSPDGSSLVYSTLLGGGQIFNATDDWGEGIAVDAAGSAYVTGYPSDASKASTSACSGVRACPSENAASNLAAPNC